MSLEVVTLISSSDEAKMLYANLIDRAPRVRATVLVRSGVELPPLDSEWMHVEPIGANGLVEDALRDYAARTPSSWLLQVDPDEFWPDEAFERARELTSTLNESSAAAFPMTYFVGPQPLRGGPWSDVYQRRLISSSSLARSAAGVHLRPVATSVERIALAVPIQHYWVNNLAELRRKHDRYLGREGPARMAKFGRYTFGKAALRMVRAFGGCILTSPWKDGLLGLRLAAEMLRYQWKANVAWRREDNRVASGYRQAFGSRSH